MYKKTMGVIFIEKARYLIIFIVLCCFILYIYKFKDKFIDVLIEIVKNNILSLTLFTVFIIIYICCRKE